MCIQPKMNQQNVIAKHTPTKNIYGLFFSCDFPIFGAKAQWNSRKGPRRKHYEDAKGRSRWFDGVNLLAKRIQTFFLDCDNICM